MRKTLISARNVNKIFSAYGTKNQILNQVDADIYDSDFTIVMGPSGAGKSSLLYALSGMDSISGGTVYYKDMEISSFGEKQMARLRAEEFGFVFQQTHLVSNLTLFENVVVAGYLNHKRNSREVNIRARKLLKQMSVSAAKDRYPFQVSGGEAQRAAIARAVINRPGLLFGDEPTGALNKSNTETVLDLLSGLNREGQSILMVTHDLRAAVRGNRLLYMEDGAITDELKLEPYEKAEAKEREAKINDWLHALRW